MGLSGKEKFSYGLGAVGKDMVYMLSASYILYYYQDILGVNAVAMGIILLVARVFDAFNDPFMGVIVAKTRTRWGKFRPWLMIGTVTNAVVLYLMFSAPPALDGNGLVAYAAVTYILWGVTYTMMDIPFWSMIPAFTHSGKEREGLSTLGRSCAGVGSAIITVITMLCVNALGGGEERVGFSRFTLIIAVLFVIFIAITCINIKEKSTVDVDAPSIGQMFKALIQNDQAMAVVITIVLINCAVYTTSNLVIYFFKYDFGGDTWYNSYTLFNTFGGAVQILAMMLLFPLLRKFMSTIRIFYVSFLMAIAGYAVLLLLCFTNMSTVFLLFLPGSGGLRTAAGVLPDGAVRESRCPAGPRHRGVCLQRNAFRADHPVPVQQRGLRPAKDRTAGGERHFLHADLRGKTGFRYFCVSGIPVPEPLQLKL